MCRETAGRAEIRWTGAPPCHAPDGRPKAPPPPRRWRPAQSVGLAPKGATTGGWCRSWTVDFVHRAERRTGPWWKGRVEARAGRGAVEVPDAAGPRRGASAEEADDPGWPGTARSRRRVRCGRRPRRVRPASDRRRRLGGTGGLKPTRASQVAVTAEPAAVARTVGRAEGAAPGPPPPRAGSGPGRAWRGFAAAARPPRRCRGGGGRDSVAAPRDPEGHSSGVGDPSGQ